MLVQHTVPDPASGSYALAETPATPVYDTGKGLCVIVMNDFLRNEITEYSVTHSNTGLKLWGSGIKEEAIAQAEELARLDIDWAQIKTQEQALALPIDKRALVITIINNRPCIEESVNA